MDYRYLKIALCLCVLLIPMNSMFEASRAWASTDAVAAPKLAAGYYHTLSLVSSGEVYAWGEGNRGQLGDATWNYRNHPVRAKGLTNVVDIHSGVRGSMALRSDGTVWTWGLNENGQLGIGTVVNVNAPVQVSGLSGIKAISGGLGYHSMALTEDGTVWTWGKNDNGELGDGTTTQRNAPVLVAGLNHVKAIAAGGYFSLALKNDGTVWAWGVNGDGELGDGTNVERHIPVQVAGLENVVAIAAGGSHSLAIKQDGTVWSWGSNRFGVLGDGTGINRTAPVQVRNVEHITDIAGGGFHSLAVDQDGQVWSWGRNDYGQLGNGNHSTDFFPSIINGLDHVVELAAGGYHSAVMNKDGLVYGWGLNTSGQIGDGTRNNVNVPTLTKAVLDTTAPNAGSGVLTPHRITSDSIGIQWPKASDNLTDQHELQYLLYMSKSANLSDVSQIERNGSPIGNYTADRSDMLVERLDNGTDYYFNVIVKDAAGVRSAYRMQKVTTKWPQIYVLTYNGNGSTEGNVPVSSDLFARGEEVTVPDNTGRLAKEGYTFSGWNTEADGSGTDYPAGSKLTFGTDSIRLFAKWSKNPDPVELAVLSYEPANQSSGAAITGTLSFTTNKEVTSVAGKKITVRQTSDNSIVESVDAANAGQVTVVGTTVIIDPVTDLAYGSTYYVEIEPGAFADAASGVPFAGIQGRDSWSFTTEKPAVPAYDTTLKGLSLHSAGGWVAINPEFDRYQEDYTSKVDNATDHLTVTAQVYDTRVQVTASVYGDAGEWVWGPIDIISGEKSVDLPIAIGSNRIEVVVAAPDGQLMLYSIAVVREVSSDGGGGTTPGGPGGGTTPETPGGGTSPGDASSGSTPSGSTGSTVKSSGQPADIRVTLNDQSQEGMVTGLFHEAERHTVVSMKLDTAKLEARLKTVEYNPVIIIALAQPADHISLELSGAAVDYLQAKQGSVEVRSSLGTFHVPASEISAARWQRLGSFDMPISADDITVSVVIAASDADQAKVVQKAANLHRFKLVGSPVHFEITAQIRDESLSLDPFDRLVERRIPLPQGMVKEMTTAVVIDADGSVYPVPTRIESDKDGGSCAVLHSFVNGTFVFISNEISFADVRNHWSGHAVNDLASRMILQGRSSTGNDTAGAQDQAAVLQFMPEAVVSRAEFAAMVVRAMGLKERAATATAFTDVSLDAWYSGVLTPAEQYGLLEGYEDGSFRPDQSVSRQEAMTVMARVMELAGLTGVMSAAESASVLSAFQDQGSMPDWAQSAAAVLVKQGIIQGHASELKPQKRLSRGEAAVMLQRLLRAAEMID